MKSLRKKLFLSIIAVAFAVVSLTTSTFAWFSMNSKVTVTGMQVETKVGDNLLIAADTLGSTAKQGEGNFKNSLVQQVSGLLEPVSTINGTSFYYTNSSNVLASGDAMANTYIAYDRATNGGKNAFDGNYGFADNDNDEDCVGYVDYVFQLKAINGAVASQIRLTTLKLTYGGTADAGKAHRVAMFVEDITSANPAGGVGALVAILTPSGAANFTDGEAVTSTSATAAVTYCDDDETALIDIDANTTKYFKVVIRLWLEGEDTTCNNATYMSLTDKWSLDLEFNLVAASAAASAVENIETAVTTSKTGLVIGTNDGVDAGAVTINGVTYYPITDKTLNTKQLYISGGKTLAADSHIFIIENNNYPTEVTNQVNITPAP